MKKKGLFVGLTGIDYIYYLDSLPLENSKCKTGQYSKYVGGPAANAAIAYAALGGDATLITAYGTSAESKTITEELNAFGVKVINLSKDDSLPGLSTICITGAGKRTIISGQSNYSQIEFPQMDYGAFDFALFDCNQQDISLPLLEELNCDIVLDAGSYKPNIEKYLKKAKTVISSEQFIDREGRNIFSMPYENITYRAMTRGEKSILTPSRELDVDSVQCVDSLAAGDIFHGAFCYASYEEGLSFEEALVYAAKIASESVKYKGPREWISYQ